MIKRSFTYNEANTYLLKTNELVNALTQEMDVENKDIVLIKFGKGSGAEDNPIYAIHKADLIDTLSVLNAKLF